MSKKNLIVILIALILLLSIGFLWEQPPEETRGTPIITSYAMGEFPKIFPKITIRNDLNGNICFSECYRYYLEKKNGGWERYIYGECEEQDLIKRCIQPSEEIILELIIDIPRPKPGLHRAAFPVCLNCRIGDNFKENQIFYSGEFLIY